MSLTDRVINSSLFRTHADKLGEEDVASLEKSVREMLASIDDIHSFLKSRMSDQEGKNEFAEALEYLLTEEGQKEWRQDKS